VPAGLEIDESKIFTDPATFTPVNQTRQIDYLILHHTGYNDTDYAIQIYRQYGASAHYLINQEGNIFRLVKDNNIAYHAGVSNWRGVESLNQYSIGIELLSPNPYKDGFSRKQIKNLIILCQNLTSRYNILQRNVLGHSDIAYTKDTGYLNRKQDPSYLFPWAELAKAGVGIFPDQEPDHHSDCILFKIGDKDAKIAAIRKFLSDIGYKVKQQINEYDQELAMAMRCFNRHYNPGLFAKDPDHSESENYIPPITGAAYQFSSYSLKQLNKLAQITAANSTDFQPIIPKSDCTTSKTSYSPALIFTIAACSLMALMLLAFPLYKLYHKPTNIVVPYHDLSQPGRLSQEK
jgi:N-acetyl-anhydromuramyl-L-alanine amidase AmpD